MSAVRFPVFLAGRDPLALGLQAIFVRGALKVINGFDARFDEARIGDFYAGIKRSRMSIVMPRSIRPCKAIMALNR